MHAVGLSHGFPSLAASLKTSLHHCGYLSSPHQFSSIPQVSVPTALLHQHRSVFDWAECSTDGAALILHLHQQLLFPFCLSLRSDPVFPSVMSWQLILLLIFPPFIAVMYTGVLITCVKSDCIMQTEPAAIRLRLQSVPAWVLLTLAKKLSKPNHHEQISDCSHLCLRACKKSCRRVNSRSELRQTYLSGELHPPNSRRTL